VIEAYERLFSRSDAALVLHDLYTYSLFEIPSFLDGDEHGRRAAHEEGMKRIVRRILLFSGKAKKMRECLGVLPPIEKKG
jgi:hypothetical protein